MCFFFFFQDEWVVSRIFHKNPVNNNNNNKKLISPQIQGLLRINSFGVDDMLDCSNSLPPLIDDSPYDNPNVDFKGSSPSLAVPSARLLNATCPDQRLNNNYCSITAPSSILHHEYQHQNQLLYSQIIPNSSCYNNSSSSSFRGSNPNHALMGFFPQGIMLGSSSSSGFNDRHCKTEQFSMSNQSACIVSVSQDTTEISSVVSKEEMAPVSNHNNNNNRPSLYYGRDVDFEGPSSLVGAISDIQGFVWDDL